MIDFQTHFVFPVQSVAPAGPLPADGEVWTVKTPGGAVLKGVHLPPSEPGGGGELILGFGGNGWNGQDVAEYLHELYPEHDVVVFHYRGYMPSTGEPSGEALIADAPLVYDAAVQRLKPARIIGIGFSIGTGVAAQLSAKRKLDGLILVTPFDSLKAVAESMYPWLPIGPFFSHEIDAATPIKDSKVRVAVIAAARDEIVPTERTNALRRVVRNLAYDRTIPNAGHNDIYPRSDFHEAMRGALEAVTG
jgi:hypothetical protein